MCRGKTVSSLFLNLFIYLGAHLLGLRFQRPCANSTCYASRQTKYLLLILFDGQQRQRHQLFVLTTNFGNQPTNQPSHLLTYLLTYLLALVTQLFFTVDIYIYYFLEQTTKQP